MADSWKLRTAIIPKLAAHAALLAHEEAADWPEDWVLTGMEVADDRPDEWTLELFLPAKPSATDKARLAALFAGPPPAITAERIAAQDWLTLSQQGVDPIRAGRFHIRTPEHPPLRQAGVVDLAIPASQAFGTGQHATTAGCLAMLEAMRARGVVVRNLVDIGTGTGLLAFAALALWPRARATASDIDPVCAGVVADNAALNALALGSGPGATLMLVADGMADPLLAARGPYDLLIANILAGPLIALAPDFASAVAPGGQVLLAGLLETQEAEVRRAYRRVGFTLVRRMVRGDWAILWLRRRRI